MRDVNYPAIILGVLVIIGLGILFWFFIFVFELPIESGMIQEKFNDREHRSYTVESNSIYRTETYYNFAAKMYSTRRVYDHTEYAIYEYIDGADYCVNIVKPSQKVEDLILERLLYVKEYRYHLLTEGQEMVLDEFEYGDKPYDYNNTRTRITQWSRSKPSILEYKDMEY